jgi:hypothetical protein
MRKILLHSTGIFLFFCSSLSLFSQDVWTPSELNGFGNSNNSSIRALLSFKGNLYAGTASDSAKIYRSSSGNMGSWSAAFTDTSSTTIDAFASTANGGGYMYSAVNSTFGGMGLIYKTFDGNTWNLYHSSNGQIKNIVPYKGLGISDTIYSIEKGSFGDIVRRSAYDSNDPYDTLSLWDTVIDFSMITPYTQIISSIVHNNKLYLGTGSPCGLWSTSNGTSWLPNSYAGSGFSDPNNYNISALGSYSGYLYVATNNYYTGSQIWRSNDDSTWTMVAQISGYERITAFITAGTELWVSACNPYSTPGMILKSTDGVTFSTSVNNGFGYGNNHNNFGNFASFGNNLYFASENYGSAVITPFGGGSGSLRGGGFSTGGQIWRTCTATPPVISIGPDQTICQGTSTNFNADPGFVSYLWNTGATSQLITVNADGYYSVIATDPAGCDATDTAQLITIASPYTTITVPSTGTATVCQGDSTMVSGIAFSNVRIPLPPESKVSNVPISYSLGNTYDTIAISGITECACTSLYSVTIDSLYHQYDVDVSIGLYSPSGYFINLCSNGASGTNFIGTEFIMSGAGYVGNTGTAPYSGQFLPIDPFSNLTGSPTGNWILQMNDNYTTDDGVLKGWTLKFSVADSILTYSWNPSTGVTMSTSLNTMISPPSTGSYIVTTTNSNGCSVQDTLNFFVPAITLGTSSDSICYGMSSSLFSDGSASTSWSPAASLSSATGTSVIATPAVTTVYTASDFIGTCLATDSILITVNTPVLVNAGADKSICFADSTTITGTATGGVLPYTFLWSGGGNSYPISSVDVSPATTTTYNFFVTDAFGCTVSDSSTLAISPSTDVYGHVGYSGGDVAGSSVVLYTYYPYLTHFDTAQTTFTDGSGNYHFASVNHQNYLVKVFPAATYTTLVPTYYGNVFLWDSATVISHYCAVDDTLDISSVEFIASSGPGYLHGLIVEDTGFVRVPGDPVPGVDVKLGRNPGGQLVANTQTDTAGEYEFMNVAFGDYTVYVDIPGLGLDSTYTFTVDSSNSTYNNLDYIVDSSMITPVGNAGVGIHEITAATERFTVYPNPSNGNATIEYNIVSESEVNLGIYNMLGVKVADLLSGHQEPGTYKFIFSDKNVRLNSGVYFISLLTNGKTKIQKIIISE